MSTTNGSNGNRWSWIAVGLIVSWSLTVAGGVWAVASERQVVAGQVAAHERQLADHEQRLRLIEEQLHRIAADVRWIRHQLENRSR